MIPLVLIPGLACDARTYGAVVPALSDIATCTVADVTGADTIAGLAASVLAQAPAGRFAVAGHSMGGYVALEILRQAPERIRALGLLCTNAHADSPESTDLRRRLVRLAHTDLDAVIETLLPKLVHPDHLDERMRALKYSMIRAVGAHAFERQQNAIIGRIDSRAHLAAIACPTLVLAAREDAIMSVEVNAEMARGIPGAALVVVEHCGHMAPVEQPAEVSAALRDLLLRTPG